MEEWHLQLSEFMSIVLLVRRRSKIFWGWKNKLFGVICVYSFSASDLHAFVDWINSIHPSIMKYGARPVMVEYPASEWWRVNCTTVIVIDIPHRGAVAVIPYVVEYLGTGNVTANEAIQEDILVSVGWVFLTLRWSPVNVQHPNTDFPVSIRIDTPLRFSAYMILWASE